MNLRDYQSKAVDALLCTRRGIVKSPAGSGKTVIAAAALQKACSLTGPVSLTRFAWVANTKEQVDQAKKAVDQFPFWGSDNIEFYCYAGCPPLVGYAIVILDECHHIAAPQYRKLLKFSDGIIWGLSATPDRADEAREDVFSLIGPIVHTVDRSPLVEAGQITEARVFIHTTQQKGALEKAVRDLAMPEIERRKRRYPFAFRHPMAAREQEGRVNWQFAQQVGIEENEARNTEAVRLANLHATQLDSVLLLVGKIEHGEALGQRIPGSLMVYSKMGAKRRREALADFQSGAVHCLIATSLADEGLDVPRANVLIQVSAGRSAAKAEQRTGRVLRAFKDPHGDAKTHGTIHDFSDIGHYFLAAQASRRIAVYRSLGYKITIL